MATIKLLDQSTQQPIAWTTDETPNAGAVIADAQAWAERNGFQTLTFWLEEGSDRKLIVQFNDEAPLAAWVDIAIFKEGRVNDIEGQLDFARGEHRRRAVGYSQFDH